MEPEKDGSQSLVEAKLTNGRVGWHLVSWRVPVGSEERKEWCTSVGFMLHVKEFLAVYPLDSIIEAMEPKPEEPDPSDPSDPVLEQSLEIE